MSLYKELAIVLFTMSLLAMAATFWINFSNSQNFLITQMQIQTEDSATALGMTLQPDMVTRDIAGIETTVNAVFDRGFYSLIRVEDADGVELFTKEQSIAVEGVPDWFSSTFQFEPPVTRRELSAGWALGGLITVVGHPGYAYQQLWQVFGDSVRLYAIGAIVLAFIGYLSLNILLAPLTAMVSQAQAIIQRKFGDPLPLPRTTELKTLVSAMNRMTENVKTTFREHNATAKNLRELAYQDSLTGLGNRRYFEAQLKAVLDEKEHFTPITLFLIQAHDFKGFNERNGYQKGDEALSAIGRVIKQSTTDYDHAITSRLSGGDFAVFIHHLSEQQAEELANILSTGFADLYAQECYDQSSVCNTGIVSIESKQEVGFVLSQADTALRRAKIQGDNAWYRLENGEKNNLSFSSRTDWMEHLKDIIQHKKISLLKQKVVKANYAETVLHHETFIQIKDKEGSPIPAMEFIMTAEQLGLSQEIDRIVTSRVVEQLIKEPKQEASPIAINLSLGALQDSEFLSWLLDTLAPISKSGSNYHKLVFEFPEAIVLNNLDSIKEFATSIHKLGHGIGLDHFGRGFSDFGYLKSLRPDYVKVDRAYTSQVADNPDTQFFVTSLSSICQTLEIDVIAQAVESQEQWDIFKSLHVDGVQGYVVGKPQ